MKNCCTLFLVVVLCSGWVAAQATAAQSAQAVRIAAGQTDLYHVHFAKAALGKSAALADVVKTQTPGVTPTGHFLVLRHRAGDEWDYAVITHVGSKATIEAAAAPPPAGARNLGEWHTDTYAAGPAWAEFAKAAGIGEGSGGNTGNYLYVVTVHRAAPGQREALEKMLGQAPDAGDLTAGRVLLQHVEGASWQYLSLDRYNSWQDYATSESSDRSQMDSGSSAWFKVRDHSAWHRDTLCDRIAP